MALLRNILIIMLMVSYGSSEKDIAESTSTEKVHHLSRRNIGKIIQTFGAIKIIGKHLTNCKDGAQDNRLNQNSSVDVERGLSKPDDLLLALLTISKNVFGHKVTEKVVKPLVNLSHGKISPDNRNCTTPEGSEGYCDDYKNCPQLNTDLFTDSICFRNMFSSGVCCPKGTSESRHDEPSDQEQFQTQVTVNILQTTQPQISTTRPQISTTRRQISTTRPQSSTTRPQSSTTRRQISTTRPQSSTTRPQCSTTQPQIFTTQSTDEDITSVTEALTQLSKDSTMSSPTSTTQSTDEDITFKTEELLLPKNSKINSECGRIEVPKFRVVGGVEAFPGQWPWMAAIYVRGLYRCGGTLIGPRHILTAAHCTKNNLLTPFKAQQFYVTLGDIDISRNDEPSSPEKYTVIDVRAHEKFSLLKTENPMLINDIAILILDRPVKRNKYIMPLCLPPASLKFNSFIGQSPTVVGWGTMAYDGEESTIQRQVSLPIWSTKDCKRIYYPYFIDKDYICAGLRKGGKDSCHGDSGGPLMLKKDGRWIQIGIVSFGAKCGEPWSPGVYTRVTGYLDWIHDNMI